MKNPTIETLTDLLDWAFFFEARVLTHARGNLSARDAVEDEESPNSCDDDTSSESSDSNDSSNDSSTRVIWSDACTEERNPTSKLGMRESMGEDFFSGGGGGSLNIIIMSGGVEINFCLMRGGVWLSFGAYLLLHSP